VIDDAIPRGVLKCHCGNPLSGTPSKGKSGKYFYYYKCRFPKHNNVSAINAHDQLLDALSLMSLPPERIKQVNDSCEIAVQKELQTSKAKISEKKSRLEEIQQMLFSVEGKWIRNEITRDIYERWYSNYNTEIISHKAAIECLGEDQNQTFNILHKNLDLLSDMRCVYCRANTLQKREFIL